MNVYFDTSVLIAIFTEDLFSQRADAFLREKPLSPAISDFAAAEFASVISRHVRMSELTIQKAREILADFDTWTVQAPRIESTTTDIRLAEAILRRLDLPLRAPDAINIAIVQRIGAELATFDVKMAECARALGTPVVAL